MRIWHNELLPYLPKLQFNGQLRELIAIMHDWKNKGTTNHILINIVMEYDKSELYRYFVNYSKLRVARTNKIQNPKHKEEFIEFNNGNKNTNHDKIFKDWHDYEYLRICMANLYEKYKYGRGKSRITEEEWNLLKIGYKKITGEDYKI